MVSGHPRVHEKGKEDAARNCDAPDSQEKTREQWARNNIELDHTLVPSKIGDTVKVEVKGHDHLAHDNQVKAIEDTPWNCDASDSQEKTEEQTARNYIELDHALEPGKIEDINLSKELETGKVAVTGYDYIGVEKRQLRKYHIEKGNIVKAIMGIIDDRPESLSVIKKSGKRRTVRDNKEPLSANDLGFEAVQGTLDDSFYFDKDWGFFSTILACYNNHWTLRTSPDDWWNVIVKTVANAVDSNGNKEPVRHFFVDHQGKKPIEVILPGRLDNVDYSWLFDQFSKGIRSNIKTPGYVDLMEADFSTTGPNQLIASQIMVMSSVQKYFSYGIRTLCGIPGVEMKGTEQDWIKMIANTKNLEELLAPILKHIGLEEWFRKTIAMLWKLLDTFKGNPDTDWWSHILSFNKRYGSGARQWWSGWMIDFLNAGSAETLKDFPSGVVSVPVKIKDVIGGPPVEDKGELVAGTFGFTVDEGERAPVVEAKQGWALLLPKGSPIIARMRKNLVAL